MKLRSFFSVLAGVVLAFLLAGAAGAYWLATASAPQLPQQSAVNPAAAMFVSRQAPAMVSLLTNPDRLKAFWLAEAPPANRTSLKTDLDQLQQSLFADIPLDYDRDLKPWLGNEVTFVLTAPDVDRDASDGLQPGYLLVLTTEDFESAQKSVQAFWRRQAAAKDLVIEQFAGVQLTHIAKKTAPDQPSLTSAVVGNRYVLFANYPKVLREALNNVQVPELSLEQSFTYQQALEKISDQRFGLVYLNFSQFGAWLNNQPLLPVAGSASSKYEGLVAALKPNAQGLLANTILLLASDTELVARPITADVSEVLKFVPSSSSVAMVSQDFEQTWAQWQNVLAASPAWTALQQRWEINSPESLLGFKGEYALAQVPQIGRAESDWVFVAQRLPETEASLEQLDQTIRQQGGTISSLLLNDQKIDAWTKLTATKKLGATSLQAEVQGVRTSVGDYEIFATSLEALEQALEANQSAASSADSDLGTAIAQVQTPNQGYLYLNHAALTERLRSIRLPTSLKEQLATKLQSALITSYNTDETGQRGAVVLHLD